MIKIIGAPPVETEIADLVAALAAEALEMGDIERLRVFWYFDDALDRTARDVLFEPGDFDEWFPQYWEDNERSWDESYIVVYSDTIPGKDELRFHVILGADQPTYALCVNRHTGEAQWYLQETPIAATMAAKLH